MAATTTSAKPTEDTVYIVDGPRAETYHADADCPIGNAPGVVFEPVDPEAVGDRGPCARCHAEPADGRGAPTTKVRVDTDNDGAVLVTREGAGSPAVQRFREHKDALRRRLGYEVRNEDVLAILIDVFELHLEREGREELLPPGDGLYRGGAAD